MIKLLKISCLLACFTLTANTQTFIIPNAGLRYQTVDDIGIPREKYIQCPIINIFTGLELSQNFTNNLSLSIEADYNIIKYIVIPGTAPALHKSHLYRLGISIKYFFATNWQIEASFTRSHRILDVYDENGSRILRTYNKQYNNFCGAGVTYWTRSFNYSIRTYFWISKEIEIIPGTEPHVVASLTIGYPLKITGWKPFQSSKMIRCPKF